MSDSELDGQALATVMASDVRQQIVATLYESPGTSQWIADKLSKDRHNNISRMLSNLESVDVVELRVPEDTRRGRVYGLTDTGRAIVEGIDAIEVDGDE